MKKNTWLSSNDTKDFNKEGIHASRETLFGAMQFLHYTKIQELKRQGKSEAVAKKEVEQHIVKPSDKPLKNVMRLNPEYLSIFNSTLESYRATCSEISKRWVPSSNHRVFSEYGIRKSKRVVDEAMQRFYNDQIKKRVDQGMGTSAAAIDVELHLVAINRDGEWQIRREHIPKLKDFFYPPQSKEWLSINDIAQKSGRDKDSVGRAYLALRKAFIEIFYSRGVFENKANEIINHNLMGKHDVPVGAPKLIVSPTCSEIIIEIVTRDKKPQTSCSQIIKQDGALQARIENAALRK